MASRGTENLAAGVRVRACEAGDIPAIAAIYGHAVSTGTASFELDPPDGGEMRRRWEALVADSYPYRVAENGGEVVGFAYAGPYRTRPAYRNTVEDAVYVRADWQGQGIGRRLLATVLEDAAILGFRQMVAVIGDSANRGSIGLHAALGFASVGVLRSVGWKHGRWLDTVLMQRPLGPGDEAPPWQRSAGP